MACSKSIIHRKKSFVQIAIRLQKLLLVYKCGISSTKTAFRLQIFDCQFTKLHFELQSCISECNSAFKTQITTNVEIIQLKYRENSCVCEEFCIEISAE